MEVAQCKVVAVAAAGTNDVIGDGLNVPWRIPDDMRRLRKFTMGCPLIMGRRTWDSLGGPLPGRGHVVMTRDRRWSAEGAIPVYSLDEALEFSNRWISVQADKPTKIVIFGGGEIYRMAMRKCDRIELTRVHHAPNPGLHGVVFPRIDPDEWELRSSRRVEARGDVPAHSFESYGRIQH